MESCRGKPGEILSNISSGAAHSGATTLLPFERVQAAPADLVQMASEELSLERLAQWQFLIVD